MSGGSRSCAAGLNSAGAASHHAHRKLLDAATPLSVNVFCRQLDWSAYLAGHIDNVNSLNRQQLTYDSCVSPTDSATELAAGNIDVLLVFNGWDFDPKDSETIFQPEQKATVQAALGNGKLKKLMVW